MSEFVVTIEMEKTFVQFFVEHGILTKLTYEANNTDEINPPWQWPELNIAAIIAALPRSQAVPAGAPAVFASPASSVEVQRGGRRYSPDRVQCPRCHRMMKTNLSPGENYGNLVLHNTRSHGGAPCSGSNKKITISPRAQRRANEVNALPIVEEDGTPVLLDSFEDPGDFDDLNAERLIDHIEEST